MRAISDRQAIRQTRDRLAELIETDCDELEQRRHRSTYQPDSVLRAGPFVFVVEWKSVATAASIQAVIIRVRRYAEELEQSGQVGEKVVPLMVVPFMGDVGRERCAEHGVSWMDLSGNARIVAPGLRILIEGKPNRHKRRGRPSTAFAPKSSRIARWLLMHPDKPLTQRELAWATGTDEGYTSRVVAKLLEEGLIVRMDSGAVRPRDPDLLLDAWQEAYDFTKHHVVRGHIAARSGEAMLHHLAASLDRASVPYAATGLAAAWSLGRFAAFRTATVYLRDEVSPDLIAEIPFHDDARGANAWLVVPNDEGVFHGATTTRDGIVCVHPVQAYLDLHAHPERAKDAARELRSDYLQWRSSDR